MVKTTYGNVVDVKHTIDSLVYVKVQTNKGVLGGYQPDPTAKKQTMDPMDLKRRVLKNNPRAVSGIEVRDKSISVSGDGTHKIETSAEFGNIISGHTTFTAHPESIRIGGVFRMNGLMTSTVPSSIVTPVPALILDIPGEGLLTMLTGIMNDAKGLFGG